MSADQNGVEPKQRNGLARRSFIVAVFGAALAALSGCISDIFTKNEAAQTETPAPDAAEARIAALEAQVAGLVERIEAQNQEGQAQPTLPPPLGELEGGNGELVVFRRKELSLINPDGVLLNLVAAHGPVGIRFYKDFEFGNEQVNNPWHMGYIEGNPGYQSLAILRDWRFTAALWDEDGKLLLGRLDPHPPANPPGRARFQVRGAVDEVQALLEASPDQSADIFQIASAAGANHLSVDSSGRLVLGSSAAPGQIILHDAVDQNAYALTAADGRLTLTRV